MKVYIKIEKTIIKFDDIKIPKQNFYCHKRPVSIKNVDIDIIVVSKAPLGKRRFKYFISYEDVKKIIPLYAFLPKITAYRKEFDETKYLSFFIKDGKELERYNEIWDKFSYTIWKEFDSNPVYNEKYLRAKIK